jgi:thiol-disulfide isomerase/thioredoxin
MEYVPIVIIGSVLMYCITKPPALPTDKPSFTFYYWSKCGHCRKMMPEFKSLRSSSIVLRSVEAGSNQELEVHSFPTIVYRDGKGSLEVYGGLRTKEAMSDFLDSRHV